MIDYDAVSDGESQAGSSVLGGEKRIEDIRKNLRWYSAASIPNLERYCLLALQVDRRCRNVENSALFHRFPGIEEQIDADLFNLLKISQKLSCCAGKPLFNLNSVLIQKSRNNGQ